MFLKGVPEFASVLGWVFRGFGVVGFRFRLPGKGVVGSGVYSARVES